MSHENDMFHPSHYEDVRLPLSRAATLPPHAYTSGEWYEQEVQKIFFKQWILLARSEEVPEPGDYLRIDWVGEPLIVVRDQESEVRVLSATCRHRGTEVVAGSGNCSSFQCPYHAWTYSLTGELLGAPDMGGVEDFDRKDWGLVPVRAESWGGFIFVNFDPESPPLLSSMGDFPKRFESYRWEDMRVTKKWVNRIDANWKIWLENSREAYHAEVVHRATYDKFYPNRSNEGEWLYTGQPGIWENQSGSNDDGLYLPRKPVFPLIEGLSESDRDTTHFVIVYPALLLNIPPSHLAFHQLLPHGPDATTVVTWMCFPETTVKRPDFEREVGRYYEIPEMFIPEDKVICAKMQRGLRARLARAGRFAPTEKPCHEFAKYLLDRMVGGMRP